MRDSFIFYRSFYESIKELDYSDQGQIFCAICSYTLEGIEPDFTGIKKSIFTLIKPQLDANIRRYENGKSGAKHGAKGGRPSSDKPRDNPKGTPKEPQDNPKLTPNVNVNDNPNDNGNDNQNQRPDGGDDSKSLGEGKTIPVPDFIDGDVWIEWVNFRKEIKKKITPSQAASQIQQLKKWKDQGHDANDIIRTSIANGWQGLFKPKSGDNRSSRTDFTRSRLADWVDG